MLPSSVTVFSSTNNWALQLEAALQPGRVSVHFVKMESGSIPLEFFDSELRVAVLDFCPNGNIPKEMSELLKNQHRRISAIVIVPEMEVAGRAGLEIGGNVHHIFFGVPTLLFLREFVLAGIEKQRKMDLEENG